MKLFSDIDFLKPKMDNNIFYLVSDYSAVIMQWMKFQQKKIDVTSGSSLDIAPGDI